MPSETLDRERVGVLLIHRRDVVEPVEIGHVLQIGARLHQLLGATMQEADVGIDAFDHFPVEFEHEPQDAVRRRMLGPEVDREVAEVLFGHRTALRECSRGRGVREWRMASCELASIIALALLPTRKACSEAIELVDAASSPAPRSDREAAPPTTAPRSLLFQPAANEFPTLSANLGASSETGRTNLSLL